MLLENHKEFIKIQKNKYKNIRYVLCPAFNNEKIYFNREGFNHLLWKGNSYRDVAEQQDRILLISKVVSILRTCKNYSTYRNSNLKGVTAHFWAINTTFKNMNISIVIRQINDGNKHFFSVFYKT